MAETNPLFETNADAFFRRLFADRHPGIETAQEQARQKMRLVAELTGGGSTVITMGDEPETLDLDLDIEPAYPATRDVLRAIYIPEEEDMAYLTAEDLSIWLPTYEARKLTPSQATAFSNTEALRDRSGPDLLKHLSRYLRSIFRPPYGPALADRIEALCEMVREEPDGESTLSGESLENLIAFLERNPELNRPSVVAGPSGELIAIWRDVGGEFTARFMPDRTIRYLLTTPNERHPQGASRVSGDTTPDRLCEDARLKELRWMWSR
jgi:hypothetical protein